MVEILHGDCMAILPTLGASSVDACVTDPPYHLTSVVKRFGGENAAPAKFGTDGAYARASRGFMGKTWDGGDIAFQPETWAEVFRVLKPGAHLLAFGGTRTFHRMMVAIEDAGFELRDTLMWTYGVGFPKSHNVSKGIDKLLGAERRVIGLHERQNLRKGGAGFRNLEGLTDEPNEMLLTAAGSPEAAEWEGWGTALKPAWEPIALFRKPLEKGLTVAQNVLKWRTGALNIDGCRIDCADKTPAPTGVYGGSAIGPTGHSGVRDGSADALGRWPANLVHDGSPEVVAAFPAAPGQQGFVGAVHGARPAVNTYGDYGVRPDAEPRGDHGSAARFFYSAKATKADRAGSSHPTVKPIALMQWLARLVTPSGGVVLDPFAGSGTTGVAAELEGFGAVLIEQSDEYVADIRRRFGQDETIAIPDAALLASEFFASNPAEEFF